MPVNKGFVVIPTRDRSLESLWGNPSLFAQQHCLSPTQLQQLLGPASRHQPSASLTPSPLPTITASTYSQVTKTSKRISRLGAIVPPGRYVNDPPIRDSRRLRGSRRSCAKDSAVLALGDPSDQFSDTTLDEGYASPDTIRVASGSPLPHYPRRRQRDFHFTNPSTPPLHDASQSDGNEETERYFAQNLPHGLDSVIDVLRMSTKQLEQIHAHLDDHRHLIPNGAAATCRALSQMVSEPGRAPRSATWWRTKMRHLSSSLTLPNSIEEMIALPARNLLDREWTSQLLPKPATRFYNWRSQPGFMPANYECYVNFMHQIPVNNAQISVLRVATLIFFFFADSSKPETWADTFPARIRRRLGRMSDAQREDIAKLYNDEDASTEKRQWFLDNLPEWRRLGSFYAWLAHKLGPGALLYLLHAFPPDKLGRFSKGARTSAGLEAVEEMKSRNLHVLAETSGANLFMHDLLWGMVQGALSKSRQGKAPFPGLEGPLFSS